MVFGAIAGLLGNVISASIGANAQKAIADKQAKVALAGQASQRADNAHKLEQNAFNTSVDTVGLSAANQQRAIEDMIEGYRSTLMRPPGAGAQGLG